jgi:hypothetical protein
MLRAAQAQSMRRARNNRTQAGNFHSKRKELKHVRGISREAAKVTSRMGKASLSSERYVTWAKQRSRQYRKASIVSAPELRCEAAPTPESASIHIM